MKPKNPLTSGNYLVTVAMCILVLILSGPILIYTVILDIEGKHAKINVIRRSKSILKNRNEIEEESNDNSKRNIVKSKKVTFEDVSI